MWATSDRASMSRPSARVIRAQQVRQRHRLGMMQRSEMDESSVNVSATATIIGIFFLLSLGATMATFYFMNRCVHGSSSAVSTASMGWEPEKQAMHVNDPQ